MLFVVFHFVFRTIALQSFVLADFVYQFVRTLEIKGIKKGGNFVYSRQAFIFNEEPIIDICSTQ